jgi:alanyl-tRNA synthetase
VSAISQELDQAVIPLARKAELRAMLAPLQDKAKAAAKQAAGAERARAIAEAQQLCPPEPGPVIVLVVPSAQGDREALLPALDAVRTRHKASAAMLFSVNTEDSRVVIVADVPPELVQKGLKAGDWVREASAVVGGKGGGRPDAAQGGGTEPRKVPDAVEVARKFAVSKVTGTT